MVSNVGDFGFCSCNNCAEWEGDCDSHSECQYDLVCGLNNCPASLGFNSDVDCCYNATLGDEFFCSSEKPCSEHQGDCDFNDECQNGLHCGSKNCPNSFGYYVVDCCYYSDPNLSEYYLHTGVKTAAGAKIFCNGLGKKLLEPKSSQVNNEVTQLAQSQGIFRFWIGVNDIANEGTFVYDSSGTTIVYENWNPGEPNDAGGEDCTEINYGNWNDMPCTWNLPFVCEKPGKSVFC